MAPLAGSTTTDVHAGSGIALPVLLFVGSFAMGAHGDEQGTDWVSFVAQQLTLGPLAGVLVGWVGSRAINAAIDRGFLTHEFCNIYLLSLAFIAYLAADLVGGNGFIAAFSPKFPLKIGLKSV